MTIAAEQHHYTLTRQFFLIGATLGVSLLIYIIYKVVIRPLLRIRFYRKQGISCDYFPIIGRFRFSIQAKKKYGDTQYPPKMKARTNPERVTCSNFFSDALLSINDPALIKEFFLNNDNYIKDPMFLEMYKMFLGDGILTAEGMKWKTQRKILSNSFNFEFLKTLLPSIQQEAKQNLLNIKNKSLTGVNIMEEFQRITGGVVGRMFFGDQINKYESSGKPLTIALADLLVDLGTLSISPDRYLLGPSFIKKGLLPKHKILMKKINSFKKVCRDIIEERKKAGTSAQRKDMLDCLLENSADGKMTEEEITDQFVTFFLAGMDTTGHLITMVIYYLEQYPEYKKQMIEEINMYYSPEKAPDMDEINKLEFTMAFLKETLRHATPVPAVFLRKAIKDHNLKDLAVRKGDIVSLNFFYNGFNPDHFKDVETFNPMRWLGKEKVGDAYAFIPFSAGPRNCIGQHLSLIEARIILAEFLNMYDYKMRDGYELKMSVKFLYEPVEDILLSLTPKSK